jgi:hypothetical protein
MNIAKCKTLKILPVSNFPVKTVLSDEVDLPSGRVMDFYINKRRSGNGSFIGAVQTTNDRAGNYWWIQHDDDSTIGIYHFTEVFDRDID